MDNAERVEPCSESADTRVAKVADGQFGVVSRRQALDAGFTARQIQLRVEARRWDVPFRGVYRIVGAPASLQQSAMAAALYAGDRALVSHATAGRLWGIEGVRGPDVELWVPPSKRADVDGLILHRGTRLDRADRDKLGPIPVTTAARTIIDLSAPMEVDRLLSAMEGTCRCGLVTP